MGTYLLVVDGRGFLQGGTQELHHGRVVEIVADVLQDVLVRHKTKRAEHQDNGDVAPAQGVKGEHIRNLSGQK